MIWTLPVMVVRGWSQLSQVALLLMNWPWRRRFLTEQQYVALKMWSFIWMSFLLSRIIVHDFDGAVKELGWRVYLLLWFLVFSGRPVLLSNLSWHFSGTPSRVICTFVVDHYVVQRCNNNSGHCDTQPHTLRQQALSAELMQRCFAWGCKFVFCCRRNLQYGVCYGNVTR